MIVIQDLHKSFHNNKVLQGIDLEINDGEVIGVIGPSGTGKSTLLRCINRLETPEKGTLILDGKTIDLSGKSRSDMQLLRENTGMVFQKFNLFEKKTALENVMEGLIVVKKLKKDEARSIALDELDKVGMLPWQNHYPRHLSGGQQQRVAIARALAMKPRLLLFDEPTSALDPELVGEVLETIRQIASEGFTMLLVSHEMNFVRNVASKVIFLDKGRIIEEGPPKEVFEHPAQERTKEFLAKMYWSEHPEYSI